MGAWGTGVFDDDSALDWVGELSRGADPEFVTTALSLALDPTQRRSGYLTSDDSSRALAAAEVVAAARGAPSKELPDVVLHWLSERAVVFDRADAALVLQAVREVGKDSELKDLWADELDSFPQWEASLHDLE